MTDDGPRHPRHDLDPLIHTPVRLSIMAALARTVKVDFRYLGDALGISDSLLSKHLTVLDDAGYIVLVKTAVGRRTRTWISLSAEGKAAYAAYERALLRIVGPGGG
ncbi:transcriptional regulator [Solwaraspora sp. WMMD1047]|uniref:transcriptional regulator n=1 Tax=Solwaraspora sp. WMMD1047 TaxID=3016102 RepID=UPI002415972A|nr:transcriptional regulator [Solwaraspora sp. WMMD1047]MDG4829489.1 transcriptional regulator [Solwaraspora sp. WMMD1047]